MVCRGPNELESGVCTIEGNVILGCVSHSCSHAADKPTRGDYKHTLSHECSCTRMHRCMYACTCALYAQFPLPLTFPLHSHSHFHLSLLTGRAVQIAESAARTEGLPVEGERACSQTGLWVHMLVTVSTIIPLDSTHAARPAIMEGMPSTMR